MKQWISKLLALLLLFVPLHHCAFAESTEPADDDDENIVVQEPSPSKYDMRVHRYRRAWGALIPTHFKVQMYGDMGLVSAGIGWDYGKRGQWETDLLFGIIPRNQSNGAKVTMTIKENFTPWSIRLCDWLAFEPLETGIYLNTIFSGEFWTNQPDRYPKGYYWFSTRVRTHIFLGQRFTFMMPEERRRRFKSFTIFYELSTCDFYVIQAINNHYLTPKDYLVLSFGIKATIF